MTVVVKWCSSRFADESIVLRYGEPAIDTALIAMQNQKKRRSSISSGFFRAACSFVALSLSTVRGSSSSRVHQVLVRPYGIITASSSSLLRAGRSTGYEYL